MARMHGALGIFVYRDLMSKLASLSTLFHLKHLSAVRRSRVPFRWVGAVRIIGLSW